jgi:hypothetical protein
MAVGYRPDRQSAVLPQDLATLQNTGGVIGVYDDQIGRVIGLQRCIALALGHASGKRLICTHCDVVNWPERAKLEHLRLVPLKA